MFGFPLREFELTHVATFESPVFEVYFKWGHLYTAVMKQLAPFGARPEDMRYEGNNPAAFVTACYLNDFTVSLRFRISAVEFWTSKQTLAERDLVPILIDIGTQVVGQVADSLPTTSSRLVMAGHFDIAGEGLRERLTHYATVVPGGDPQLLPAGLVWDGKLPNGAKATVRLERSLKYTEPNVAFARVDYEYDGATPTEDAWKSARGFVAEIVSRLRLTEDTGK